MQTETSEQVNITNHLQVMLCMCDSLIEASIETAGEEYRISSFVASMAFEIRDKLEECVANRGEIPETQKEEFNEFLKFLEVK